MLGLAAFFGARLPSSFLPDEDQGYCLLNSQLPEAASLQRTDEVAARSRRSCRRRPASTTTTRHRLQPVEPNVSTTYNAFFFVDLKEWKERQKTEEQYQFILKSVNQKLAGFGRGTAFLFSPPAIPGVGTSGGFTFVLEDRSAKDIAFLAEQHEEIPEAAARKRPEIASVDTTFLPNVPQQFIAVDRDKVLKQGVDIKDVYRTIQAFMGGSFINYFNRFGRQWQVYVEAEGDFRGPGRKRRTVLRPEPNRRHGAAVRADDDSSHVPVPNSPCATTCTARRRSSAVPRPGTAPPRR